MNLKIKAMIFQISWTDYFLTILALLAVYYAIILFTFYRKDFASILSKKAIPAAGWESITGSENSLAVSPGKSGSVDKRSIAPNSGELLVQSLADELAAFLQQAGEGNFDKSQIGNSLSLLLQKYTVLAASPYKEVIQNLMIQQCESYCSVHFSEAEIERLWRL